jgi:hypothetical protein
MIIKTNMTTEDLVIYKTQDGDIVGKTQTASTNLYNLDVIISVGYRVKSKRGTQFRIWANKVLKDYIIKGYAVNENLQLEQYNSLNKWLNCFQIVNLINKNN